MIKESVLFHTNRDGVGMEGNDSDIGGSKKEVELQPASQPGNSMESRDNKKIILCLRVNMANFNRRTSTD